MNQILKQEKNIATLKITVGNEAFENACKQAYNKNKGKFNIPGFRKGKATRSVIEKMYGEGAFYEDAIDLIFPEAYKNAVEELNLEVIDRPALDIEEIGKDKDLVMVINVAVKPEVKLGEYKGLEVKAVDTAVTDEDVEAELKRMQEQSARMVTVEDRPVADQDNLLFDFCGSVDGVEFEGGKAENYSLVVGSNTFIPGFEEQLIGMKAGESKDIVVTFPEDYNSEELKGKEAVFAVVVNEIKEKQLPEIDDEFVKDTTEFENIEELKSDIKSKMAESKKKQSEDTMKNEVVEKLAENIEVEIPEVMIKNEIDSMLKDFENNLRYQGMDLNTYYQYTETSKEILEEQMKDDAEKRVKISLAVDAVSKVEGVEATEEDMEAEYVKMAEIYKLEVEKIKEIFQNSQDDAIKSTIVARKTVDLILANAKLV
ncbi:trigger factor [Proteocatella sphenisci]|uniref:trigger factor n=1 Tax=Proteocatella sphenisci TaxID=181070 RepID=UPI00048CA16C|nr:trigger factor [Proteocatella sphenisci]